MSLLTNNFIKIKNMILGVALFLNPLLSCVRRVFPDSLEASHLESTVFLKPSNQPLDALEKVTSSSVAGSSLVIGKLAPDHIRALMCWEVLWMNLCIPWTSCPLNRSQELIHVNEM